MDNEPSSGNGTDSMNYWLWKSKPERHFSSHVLGEFGEGYDRETMWQVHSAEPLTRPWPGLVVVDCTPRYDDEKRPPSDYLMVNNETNFVASDKLRSVLESQGVGAEYFPVEISDPDVAVDQAYWFVRILERVDAGDVLDHAASEYVVDTIGIGTVAQLVFVESKLPDTPLLRLDGGPSGVLAHDRLKQAAEAEGVTGVYFLHPEERDKGPVYYHAFVEAATQRKA